MNEKMRVTNNLQSVDARWRWRLMGESCVVLLSVIT